MSSQTQHGTTSRYTTKAFRNDHMARAMALNLADWHRSSVQHFGIESAYTDSLWWREPGGSGVYLAALVHNARPPDADVFEELQDVAERWGAEGYSIYDCFATRDLTQVGLELVVKNPWYVRSPAAPPPLDLPQGLTIEIVQTPQQLADFERATWEGFEEPDNPEEAFRGREIYSQHPMGTLEDPGMVYLNARLEGEVVASVIIHITEDMQGVYGISTLMRHRRRGYASALMRAALALRPDLPMSVFPDPVSLPVYSVTGFERAGEISIWQSRPGPKPQG
jgi:GNAT superfamily N-acetyltransferase